MTTIRFDEALFPSYPDNWRTPTGITEVFLITAALELRERRAINPLDPFASTVHARLPLQYRYDPLGSLTQIEPRIARYSLLQLIYTFIFDYLGRALAPGTPRDIARMAAAVDSIGNATLGPHGTTLFHVAFRRMWLGEEKPSSIEVAYWAGDPIPGIPAGVLHGNATLLMESLWMVAFRIIERRGPDKYLAQHAARLPEVQWLLDRGAELGAQGNSIYFGGQWPGFRPR